ncbi:hypothetical protein ACFXGA_09705 [Actinosynnema sp. NPDC059335]|uniref:hypothetical protein n=1 Tax=Actinosynnema sp. NPDC059335 TaxID=3346804 RepID=UPI0036730CFD
MRAEVAAGPRNAGYNGTLGAGRQHPVVLNRAITARFPAGSVRGIDGMRAVSPW